MGKKKSRISSDVGVIKDELLHSSSEITHIFKKI